MARVSKSVYFVWDKGGIDIVLPFKSVLEVSNVYMSRSYLLGAQAWSFSRNCDKNTPRLYAGSSGAYFPFILLHLPLGVEVMLWTPAS